MIEGENEFKYVLPKFSDPEKTEVEISIMFGLKNFMKFEKNTRTMSFKPEPEDAGEYFVTVKL